MLSKIFRRGYKLSLNRVHDRVRVSEGEESMLLIINGDAMRMVAQITEAAKMLKELNSESTPGAWKDAAQFYASAIFGGESAGRLMAFYGGDAMSVINLCGKYLNDRLGKLITKAQKKSARK